MTIPAEGDATVQPGDQPTTEESTMLPEIDGIEPFALNLDHEADGPEQAVFLALGAASTCWHDLSKAGIFQSTRARQIGDELMEYLYAHGLPRG